MGLFSITFGSMTSVSSNFSNLCPYQNINISPMISMPFLSKVEQQGQLVKCDNKTLVAIANVVQVAIH